MTCVYPIDAWRAAKCNDSGKRGVTFRIQDAFTDQPLQLPCGKCIGCNLDRAREWSIRMVHEASLHERNAFITLTYEDSSVTEINKRDLQLFFKRLRHDYAVRYFACGEYGEKTRRPHYHAIVFGEDFLGGAYKVTDKLWGNPYLTKAWGNGIAVAASVSPASCAYVAGYCVKKQGAQDTFTMQSRRPPIGRTWAREYADQCRRTELVCFEKSEFPVPKKYIEWEPTTLDSIKRARRRYFLDLDAEQRYQRVQHLRSKERYYEARQQSKAAKTI